MEEQLSLESSLLPVDLPDINYICQTYLPDCQPRSSENSDYFLPPSPPLPPPTPALLPFDLSQEVTFGTGDIPLPLATVSSPGQLHTNLHLPTDDAATVTSESSFITDMDMFQPVNSMFGEKIEGKVGGRNEAVDEYGKLLLCSSSLSPSCFPTSSFSLKLENEDMKHSKTVENSVEIFWNEPLTPLVPGEEPEQLNVEEKAYDDENDDDDNNDLAEENETCGLSEAVNIPSDLLMKIRSKTRKRERGPKSWEFLMRLLVDPRTNPKVIRWEDQASATFRLIQPDIIAAMWSSRGSNKTAELSYNNFARGLRHHYTTGALRPVMERQLVYMCGSTALSYLEDLKQQRQQDQE